MRPVQHQSNNAVLGAPAGWDQAEAPVHALPITRLQFDDTGGHAVLSYWRLTDAELAAIAAGAPICPSVMGATMPPVAIGVDGLPFEDW
ncbi:MAG: hypothetical protein HYX47_10465 [Burkholderiales bacterium]|nr:hypothetical protein [Burkholderiales bacterium]